VHCNPLGDYRFSTVVDELHRSKPIMGPQIYRKCRFSSFSRYVLAYRLTSTQVDTREAIPQKIGFHRRMTAFADA